MLRRIKILSAGKYMPGKAISSDELEANFNIEKGWCEKYSGVKFRYFANGETGAQMGAKALQNALNNANINYDDLDLIIFAAASYDYPVPHTCCIMQSYFTESKKDVPGFDIDATCLSFVMALETCSYLLLGDQYNRIAIVTAEIASNSLDKNDNETFTLLGDGATAVIVESPKENEDSRMLFSNILTKPSGARNTIIHKGGNANPGIHRKEGDVGEFAFKMDGKKLLRLAHDSLKPFCNELMKKSNLQAHDFDWIIPHQASKTGLELFRKIYDFDIQKFIINIDVYGNTLAASIPITLSDLMADNKIKRGDKILIIGSGAGFSLGGMTLIF